MQGLGVGVRRFSGSLRVFEIMGSDLEVGCLEVFLLFERFVAFEV